MVSKCLGSMLAYFLMGFPLASRIPIAHKNKNLKQESGEEVASSQVSSSGGLYVRQP